MSTPKGIATGDFNGDGRDDLAVLVLDVGTDPLPQANVLVYLNIGNGFAQPVTYSLGGSAIPQCLEAFDVTGDGAPDLLGCNSMPTESGDAEGLLAVLTNGLSAGKPTGTFQSTSDPVGTNPSSVDSADIDGDGHADLLVLDGQRLWILYGTGGSFGSPTALTGVGTPAAALIDVLPGQRFAQLLVEDDSTGKLFSIKQTAARVFAAPSDITPLGQLFAFPRKATPTMIGLPTVMQLAKINGDQINDLVVLSGLGADLWYGQSDGTFAFGEKVTNDNSLDGLALADLNGDGQIDVAASDSTHDRVTVILNGPDVPPTPTSLGSITPTPTRTGAPGQTGTPTTGRAVCPGDCEGNRTVTIADLIKGVNIALGQAAIGSCPAFDLDNNGKVTINELIAAVNSVLDGCPS